MDPTFTPASEVQAALCSFPRNITLESGMAASQTRPLKGRDAVAAHRVVGKDGSDIEKGCALIAQVLQINGKAVVMEDLLDLDLDDLLVLTEAVTGKAK